MSAIIFFPHTEKCGMYVIYRISDGSRNVFIIRLLALYFQIIPDFIFKPFCISFSNFVLGFGAYASLLRNICSVEGPLIVLFQ